MATHLSQNPDLHALCVQLDELLRADPANRGVARLCAAQPRPRASQLESAATSLAGARSVAIITGFCIVDASTPVAETDGPPGALYLAELLHRLGKSVALVSDLFTTPALGLGCDLLDLPPSTVRVIPFENDDLNSVARRTNAPGCQKVTDDWVDQFLATELGCNLTHLVSVERAGPSHTPQTAVDPGDAAALSRFQHEVPPEEQNVCHNVRGAPINAYTAKTHRLFEIGQDRISGLRTIGIGDNGNEIGFGAIPWEQLRQAIDLPWAGRIACRVPTDDLLIGGVSDWAAYALAVAVAVASGRHPNVLSPAHVERQGRLIERLVADCRLVDGMTRRQEASVDGLPLDDYLGFLQSALHAAS